MSARTNPDGDKVDILIAEDSPTQAEQLRHLLERHRYRVTVANDGKQGLALLSVLKPALVICDIVMPEMDGYEFCRRIKADESSQDIPVILLTSLSDPADVLEGLACGADNFITKPYGEDYLLSHIEQVLANRKLRKGERVRVGVEILFAGKRRFITADQQQMLTLLISTYEAAVHRNAELIQTQGELRSLNEHLEDLVEARTAALSAEIVERKRAEEALRESSALNTMLLQTMPLGMDIVDETGQTLFLSPAMEIAVGQSALGTRCWDLYKDDKQQCADCPLTRSIEVGVTRTLETSGVMGGKAFEISHTGIFFRGRKAILEVFHDITNRKLAEAEIRRRADEFAALYDTTQGLNAHEDLTKTLEMIVERASVLLAGPRGLMYLYDATADTLELRIDSKALLPSGARLAMGEGLAGRVARSRQPMIVDNYSTWEGRAAQYKEIPIAAALEVPMLYRGELIGVLGVSEVGEAGRRFGEAEARLLSLFASQAAGAVHNARLLEETRRRLADLETVHTISAALRAAQTRDEALPILLDETLAALETDAGAISLYHADSGELISAVDRGWFAQLDKRPAKPDEGIGGRVFATAQTYRSVEFQTDPLGHASRREQTPPGWAGACVPIRTGAITIGVLYVSVPLPRQITTEQVRLLESLAEMAGAALHRMRLHDETVRQLEQLQALRNIDLAIIASSDLSMTLNVLLEHVLTQLKVDAASILLLNPHQSTLEYAAGRGFRTESLQHTRQRLGEGYAGRAALERKSVHIPDLLQRKTDFLRSPGFSTEGFAAYYAVPLIAKGHVQGVLEAFHRAPLAAAPDWIGFLEALAGQAAIAIDNAQLFDGLQRSNVDLTLAYDATIEGWSRALDMRDKETEGHTRRVTEMTERLARVMGMSDEDLGYIRRGALLHDIGKMGIPDAILLKPGPLTDDEWVIMRKHPTYAYELLVPITYLQLSLDIPYCHHEKWDGSGYPRGLKGEQIPLAARLFAIVDVWDALRSDRPYRVAWPEAKVIEHLKAGSGTHFDPKAVELFLKMMSEEAHQHGQGAGYQ